MSLSTLQSPILQGTPVQRALWCSLHVHLQLRIFSYATLPAAAILGSTSRETRSMFFEIVRKRIEQILRRFSLPPTATLSMLEVAKAVVSGSAVLSIIVPGVFIPQDIDIYVAQENAGVVERFLRRDIGLIRCWSNGSHRRSNAYYRGRQTGIQESKYYFNPITRGIINIVVTKTRVSTTPMFVFNSTSVMNYFTSNSIVCAYPRMTADLAGLANTHLLEENRKTARWYQKYESRGIRALTTADEWDPGHQCHRSGYCGSFTRSVDDRWTMRLTFQPQAPNAPDIVDGAVRWKLACRTVCGYPYHYPRPGFAESGHGDRLVNAINLPLGLA